VEAVDAVTSSLPHRKLTRTLCETTTVSGA